MSTEISAQSGDLIVLAGMFRDVTVELLHSFGDNPTGLLIWCSAWIAVAFLVFMRGPARKVVDTLKEELDNLKDELHDVKEGQNVLADTITASQKERMSALQDIQSNLQHLNDRLDRSYDRFADKDRLSNLEKSMAQFTTEMTTILNQMQEMSRDQRIVTFLQDRSKD